MPGGDEKDLVIEGKNFIKMVGPIIEKITADKDVIFDQSAIKQLHFEAEQHMVSVFKQAMMLAKHAKRKTLMKKDFTLLKNLQRLFLTLLFD